MTVIEVDTDRCDACPHDAHVEAFVYATFTTGSLALCGHCATDGWDELNRQALTVIDRRYLIPK